MLGRLSTINNQLDLLNGLSEEVSTDLPWLFEILNLFFVFYHKALIKEIEDLHLLMLVAFHELHELFSNLTCFGISSEHSHSGVWNAAMQICPHLAEGLLEVFSFDNEGQLEARGFRTVFEVGQEVDWIEMEVPLRSEAYMMICVGVIEIIVSARL